MLPRTLKKDMNPRLVLWRLILLILYGDVALFFDRKHECNSILYPLSLGRFLMAGVIIEKFFWVIFCFGGCVPESG